MNAKNHNTSVCIVLGLVLLLCSLPAVWMTPQNTTLRMGGFEMSFLKTNGFGFTVTGLNGYITALGISFPIWLVVILGCLSFVLFFLKTFLHLDIPKAAGFIPWMPALSLGRFQC